MIAHIWKTGLLREIGLNLAHVTSLVRPATFLTSLGQGKPEILRARYHLSL